MKMNKCCFPYQILMIILSDILGCFPSVNRILCKHKLNCRFLFDSMKCLSGFYKICVSFIIPLVGILSIVLLNGTCYCATLIFQCRKLHGKSCYEREFIFTWPESNTGFHYLTNYCCYFELLQGGCTIENLFLNKR